MSKSLIAVIAALSLLSPAAAQRADRPLGELLDIIPDDELVDAPEPPPPPAPRRPLPPSGIGTTSLPPATIIDEPEPLEVETLTEADAVIAEPSAEEMARLLWEAEERLRIEALDRAREQRADAARRAHETAIAEHERQLAEREDEIARAETEYQAELDRRRAEADRQRVAWEARVRACQAGDRTQCARPGEY